MKTENKNRNQVVIFLLLFVIALVGCKEQNSIGLEILPSGDLINVKSVIIKEDISAFTHKENLIRTDEASTSLLGSFTDSLFGNTTIDFAAQFRLSGFPDFGKNAALDSINLYLYYRVIYGDTLTPQRFKVYELEEDLYTDVYDSTANGYKNYSYYQDVDLKSLASTQLLGEKEYIPRVSLDSASQDTFYQVISIPLDISLGEKLFNADSLQMVNNDVFLEYFKGLYVETEKLNEQGGTVLYLAASSSSIWQGSAVALFYHNDDIQSKLGGDSALVMPYVISSKSARVNRIVHDYTNTPFYNNLNSETNEDSLIFIQATGGLKSRIFIDDLTSWADSTNTAINKAELIFQIDTIASQVSRFPPPDQLLFTIVDSADVERLPQDYSFSPAYYGGGLLSDYTYHFNITQHLQQIIGGKAENRGFYLTPARKNNEANRVVLKGSTSATGIRLIITYSKFTN
ncbi:MAG: DUF4270 domain-containing protein [Draconibacterium sp.]